MMRSFVMFAFAVVLSASACDGPLEEPTSAQQEDLFIPPIIIAPPWLNQCNTWAPWYNYNDWINNPWPLYWYVNRAATFAYPLQDNPELLDVYGVDLDHDEVTFNMQVPRSEMPTFLAVLGQLNQTLDPASGRSMAASHVASTPGQGPAGSTPIPSPRPGGVPKEILVPRAHSVFNALEYNIPLTCSL